MGLTKFDMNSRCLAIAIEGLFGDVEPMEFAQVYVVPLFSVVSGEVKQLLGRK